MQPSCVRHSEYFQISRAVSTCPHLHQTFLHQSQGFFFLFPQLKSNNVNHRFTNERPPDWSRACMFLFWWRALGPWLDGTCVNADSPPRTNRHGKEAEEAIISVCSRAEWVHLWEHQQLHLYCERLFPADQGEKHLFRTVFGTCSFLTRFLTVIINHRQHSAVFQAWHQLLKTPQRKASCLCLVIQNSGRR